MGAAGGPGTLTARMLAFSVTVRVSWVVILTIFDLTGRPFGPGQFARL